MTTSPPRPSPSAATSRACSNSATAPSRAVVAFGQLAQKLPGQDGEERRKPPRPAEAGEVDVEASTLLGEPPAERAETPNAEPPPRVPDLADHGEGCAPLDRAEVFVGKGPRVRAVIDDEGEHPPLVIGEVHGQAATNAVAEGVQLRGDGFMADDADGLGQQLEHRRDIGPGGAGPGGQLSRCRLGQAGVHVELEAEPLDPAGDVQLADGGQIELVKEAVDVEALVGRVALEVVEVDQEAASGTGGEGVEESCGRVVPSGIGQQPGRRSRAGTGCRSGRGWPPLAPPSR